MKNPYKKIYKRAKQRLPHLNVGKPDVEAFARQSLGRLFRMGQNPVVVVPPPEDALRLERIISARIKERLMFISETLEKSSAEDLMLPFQKRAAKRLLRDIKKAKGLTIS